MKVLTKAKYAKLGRNVYSLLMDELHSMIEEFESGKEITEQEKAQGLEEFLNVNRIELLTSRVLPYLDEVVMREIAKALERRVA